MPPLPLRHAAGARHARLGLARYCGWTRDGRFIVKHKTRSLTRKLTALRQDVRRLMHASLAAQHRWYPGIPRGHCGYDGRPHNWRSLKGFRQAVRRSRFNCPASGEEAGRAGAWARTGSRA